MTVSQLIEKLQKLEHQNQEILVWDDCMEFPIANIQEGEDGEDRFYCILSQSAWCPENIEEMEDL